MTRKIRLIIFISLVFLYLLISPILIVYSLGYRVDFVNKKLVGTGGIYLKIWPQQSQISVGEKINKETSLFSNELLIQGLLPKTYKITAKKEGYYDWEKDLAVENQQVTRIDNITLIKKDISFEKSKEKISGFYLSPTRTLILFWDFEGQFSLVNIQTKIEINSFSLPFENISLFSWDENTKVITLKSANTYFSLNYNKTGPIEPEETSLQDQSNLITTGKLTFKKDNNYIYLFNPEKAEFDQFYQAKDVIFSPDKSKFLFYNDHEILLGESKAPDQKNFLMRFAEKVNKCFWLNNYYIIFDLAGKIKISEIDTRYKINIVDLGEKIKLINDDIVELKNPEIFFDEINKKLYILSKAILFVSEPLTDRNNK